MPDPINHLLDNAVLRHFHQLRAEEHGPGTPGALGWPNPAGQQARFAALAGIADLAHCTVLDAGCGHADLYPFMRRRFPGVRYCGIEQQPELLDVAQARYGHDRRVTLGQGDFLRAPLPPADYVLASGCLNYRHRTPASSTRLPLHLPGHREAIQRLPPRPGLQPAQRPPAARRRAGRLRASRHPGLLPDAGS